MGAAVADAGLNGLAPCACTLRSPPALAAPGRTCHHGTTTLLACTFSQVAAASRRILALQQLLGGGDVDVVWMLVREPRLLSADFRRSLGDRVKGQREMPREVCAACSTCVLLAAAGQLGSVAPRWLWPAAHQCPQGQLRHMHVHKLVCPNPCHFCSITQRLFDMRVAAGSDGLDIIALVEQQPALLLQADAAVSSEEEETAAERLQVG